jgi:hypothetical protein
MRASLRSPTDRALARAVAAGEFSIGEALELCAAVQPVASDYALEARFAGGAGHQRRSPHAGTPGPTLRDAYRRFMAWYRLPGSFLPIGDDHAGAARAAQLVHRVHALHDVVHVLCEYETSDADEVALHSFMFGQCAAVQAQFLCSSFQAAPDTFVFKHLRDLRDAALSAEDFERGVQAEVILMHDFAPLMNHPVAWLRTQLRIPPRPSRQREHRNTCGGVPEPLWSSMLVPPRNGVRDLHRP